MSTDNTINCALSYPSRLEESEYLPQMKAVKDLLESTFGDAAQIGISLGWPEAPTAIHTTVFGGIWIGSDFSDIDRIMNDQKDYLSFEQAKSLLEEWLPPLRNAGDMSEVEETYYSGGSGLMVEQDGVYYVMEIYSDGSKSSFSNQFYVNACDGSISTWFNGDLHAEVAQPTRDQIEAVLACVKGEGKTIGKDATFRALLVGGRYIHFYADFANATYELTETDGLIKAKVYFKW